MTPAGTILLADDEDTFLEATKDLLEEEGFACHGVRNATELSDALSAGQFDLLITDLNMPGNRIMEKVSELREQSKVMPVIVVTGYPSVPTAVESVRLNVMEYMIKPINFPALLNSVKRAIQHKQLLNTLSDARHHAEAHVQNLSSLEETLSTFQVSMNESASDALLSSVSSISQVQPIVDAPTAPSMTDYYRLRESVFHTIQVLQKTKSAFRSKDLAGLRKYLEEVLGNTTEPLKSHETPTDKPSKE